MGAPSPRKLAAALLALASVTACSARSALDVPAPSAASSAAASSSGAGGGPAQSACAALTQTGSDFSLGDNPGYDVRRPALSLLGDGRVAVVFALDPAPGGTFAPLADVAVSPWGAWPPALTATHVLSGEASTSFALAPRPGTSFSVLYDLEGLDPPFGMVFGEDVEVMGYAGGTLFDPSTGAALFAATQGDRHLTGVDHTKNGTHALDMRVFSGATAAPMDFSGFACGDAPLVGAAIPFGADTLAAISSSVVVGSCPAPGAPAQVEVVQVSLHSVIATPIVAIQYGSAIQRVALTPTTDGAWLLAQTTAGVRAEQLDASGNPTGSAPFYAAPAGSQGFAAAPLGDAFALAWVDPDSTTIRVAVVGAGGVHGTPLEITFGPQAMVDDPLALQVAPDGATLLLAWAEKDAGTASQVHVARFACAGGG